MNTWRYHSVHAVETRVDTDWSRYSPVCQPGTRARTDSVQLTYSRVAIHSAILESQFIINPSRWQHFISAPSLWHHLTQWQARDDLEIRDGRRHTNTLCILHQISVTAVCVLATSAPIQLDPVQGLQHSLCDGRATSETGYPQWQAESFVLPPSLSVSKSLSLSLFLFRSLSLCL